MSRPPGTPAPRTEARDTTWFLVKLLIFVLILRSFVFSPFNIPSESMLPRLMIGDYLVVAKWPFGFSNFSMPFSPQLWEGRVFAHAPARGDVVVFRAPADPQTDYIKRVIGLPGDSIRIVRGQIILNGKPIAKTRIADFIEPLTPNSFCAKTDAGTFRERNSVGGTQCRYPQFEEILPEGKHYAVLDTLIVGQDDTQTYVVPKDHLFLMGDNRDHSADSRFAAAKDGGVGMVPMDNLVGRAWFGIFSVDGTAVWGDPKGWLKAVRGERIGTGF